MGFKAIDWECDICGDREVGSLTWVRHGDGRPDTRSAWCPTCEDMTPQHALMGMPAPYMGEKVCNPKVYGGEFDTMGHVEEHDLPDLPGAADHSRIMAKRMKSMPDNASSDAKRAAFKDASRDAPSSADYSTLFETKEYKEVEAKNERIRAHNTEKRARAAAWKAGQEINMKRDKCGADPKITA